MKLKIRKGATVEILAGSDKGKKGAVLAVDVLKLKIKVQGVRVQTHFDKKEGQLQKEGFIDYSNVRLVEPPKKTAVKKTSSSRKTAET